MSEIHQHEEARWPQVAPFVEEAMARLGALDRDALVLRFLEEQPLRAVGAALGISEDAARMRVERALQKLRTLLLRRGIAISAGALAAMLTSDAVGAVPRELATAIAAKALTDAASSGPPLPALLSSAAFKAGLAGVILLALIASFMWRFKGTSTASVAATTSTPALQQPQVPRLNLQAAIRRSSPAPSVKGFVRPNAASGTEMILDATPRGGISDYRLTILPVVEADRIRIESTFLESASDPASKALQVPTVILTSGQSATSWLGRYSFEFSATVVPPTK